MAMQKAKSADPTGRRRDDDLRETLEGSASSGAHRSIPISCTRATKRVPGTLKALVNRRVAWWNGCEYCQDAHAAKGSRLGISTEKIEALDDYEKSPLFGDVEKVALQYADSITDTHRDVVDELGARLQWHYDDDTSAELTMIIAWQNASSRFNHAFRFPS
jgi:AhpD family alkylhydroperoxidase